MQTSNPPTEVTTASTVQHSNGGGRMSSVYLLHFHEPINPERPAQHYLGSTNDLDRRIREHRQGTGARLCQVAKERGIGFILAEVWFGDRRLERQLKRQKNSPKFCPICANRSRRGGVNHAAS